MAIQCCPDPVILDVTPFRWRVITSDPVKLGAAICCLAQKYKTIKSIKIGMDKLQVETLLPVGCDEESYASGMMATVAESTPSKAAQVHVTINQSISSDADQERIRVLTRDAVKRALQPNDEA